MMLVFASFLLRDFRQTLSYKLAFLLDVASVFFTATTFFYVGKMFDASATVPSISYPTGYFPFVLIGIAFSTYQTVGLNSFAQSLRQEQYLGTLESVLVTPIRISTFLAGSALWDFFYATLQIGLYFAIGLFAFHFNFDLTNVLSALLAGFLTLTTFMGLGILAAAFILKFKRGNPIAWLMASLGELFGGVYFPTTILPDWMKSISNWMPMTHALTALRKSILSGADVAAISENLWFLLVFTLVVWPIGIWAFQAALRRSQVDGSLSHY